MDFAVCEVLCLPQLEMNKCISESSISIMIWFLFLDSPLNSSLREGYAMDQLISHMLANQNGI